MTGDTCMGLFMDDKSFRAFFLRYLYFVHTLVTVVNSDIKYEQSVAHSIELWQQLQQMELHCQDGWQFSMGVLWETCCILFESVNQTTHANLGLL